MILGFKTQFPDGTPTNFPAKIMLGLPPRAAFVPGGYEVYGEAYEALLAEASTPKIHTVRDSSFDKNGFPRWVPGETVIHFATGVRTPMYLNFAKSMCLYVAEIKMYQHIPSSSIQIYVDEKKVDTELFCGNDGFDSYQSFHEWFSPLIQQAMKDGKPCYQGDLIQWTNFRY